MSWPLTRAFGAPIASSTCAIGPRVIGGRYYDSYWCREYTVLHIGLAPESRIIWSDWSITARWADGREGTHCTSWDRRCDRVIAQPDHDMPQGS